MKKVKKKKNLVINYLLIISIILNFSCNEVFGFHKVYADTLSSSTATFCDLTFPAGINSDFYYADNTYNGTLTLNGFNFGYAAGRWLSIKTIGKDGAQGPDISCSTTWGKFYVSTTINGVNKNIAVLQNPVDATKSISWRTSYNYSISVKASGDGKAYVEISADDPIIASDIGSTGDTTFVIDGIYALDRSVYIGDCGFNLKAEATSTNPPPMIPNAVVPSTSTLGSEPKIKTSFTDSIGDFSYADQNFAGKVVLSNLNFDYPAGRWLTLYTVGKDGSRGPSICISTCWGVLSVSANKTLKSIVANGSSYAGKIELVALGDGKAYLTVEDRTFEIDGVYEISKNIEVGGCSVNLEAYSASSIISGLSAISALQIRNGLSTNYESYAGDPVNTSTGAHEINYTLMKQNSCQSFDFNIDYNSLMLNDGEMGRGWNNNYNTTLKIDNDNLTVNWSSNYKNTFKLSHDNVYTCGDLAMKNATLYKNSDGSYQLTDKDFNNYYFNQLGQLIEKKNKIGQAIEYTYDTSGKLTEVQDAISKKYYKFKYNTNGLLERVTDGMNRSISFGYDSSNNLTSIKDANGNTKNYTYNDKGQVLTCNSDGTQIFKNTYDSFGRVIQQDDSLSTNKLSTFSYDEASKPGYIVTTVTDRNGNSKTLTHDSKYNLVSVTDENGNTKTYTHDENGNISSETDELHNTTKSVYDNYNHLTEKTDSTGLKTSYTYDNNENMLTQTNPDGSKITYTYDSSNRVTSMTDLRGNVTNNTYDSNGLLIKKDVGGNIYTYTYEKGLIKSAEDSKGGVTTYVYDGANYLKSTTDSTGKTCTNTYDADGNLLSKTDSLGNKTSYTYDSRGNILTQTDCAFPFKIDI